MKILRVIRSLDPSGGGPAEGCGRGSGGAEAGRTERPGPADV